MSSSSSVSTQKNRFQSSLSRASDWTVVLFSPAGYTGHVTASFGLQFKQQIFTLLSLFSTQNYSVLWVGLWVLPKHRWPTLETVPEHALCRYKQSCSANMRLTLRLLLAWICFDKNIRSWCLKLKSRHGAEIFVTRIDETVALSLNSSFVFARLNLTSVVFPTRTHLNLYPSVRG